MAQEASARFVVVDVETTGVYNSDRVVEVAAVGMAADGTIIDEWDTLVNPGRDVGPTHIHGVTASMISAAPDFEEVSVALASRINGRVLVAHNLAFDARMLANEFSRVGAILDCGRGVCTLLHCGQRLADACAALGVGLDHHHRALADARSTAKLFVAASCRSDESFPAWIRNLSTSACPRTLRREAVCEDGHTGMTYLARLAAQSKQQPERGKALLYLDLLDWVLDDLIITSNEWSKLSALSLELGMTALEVESAHKCYFRGLVSAAIRDGKVTDHEYKLLKRVAEALCLEDGVLEDSVAPFLSVGSLLALQPGMRVCFTGAATHADGSEMSRSELVRVARSLSLKIVDSVTKKGCDLVVASDKNSLSGKASKARAYGIPIADVQDFICAEQGSKLEVS